MNGWRHIDHVARSGNRITAEVREGNGPTLFLVPGTWGNAQTRGPLIQNLDDDLNVVCVALAGQDDNWPPPESPSIPQFTDDVISLADDLGCEKFFVGGNSLGGMIAIDALRFGAGRISGAIAIEGWTHSTVSRNAFQGDTGSTLDAAQSAFLKEVRKSLLDRWDPEQKSRYSTMWKEWDGWEILESIEIPVLEIWGDRARKRPSRDVMRIPDREIIQLEWIPGASHSLLVEAPKRLAELINRFLRSSEPQG